MISSATIYDGTDVSGPVVYGLHLRNELIYVGSTSDLKSRLRNHRKDKAFDKVMMAKMPSMPIARCLEGDLIASLRPPMNFRQEGAEFVRHTLTMPVAEKRYLDRCAKKFNGNRSRALAHIVREARDERSF